MSTTTKPHVTTTAPVRTASHTGRVRRGDEVVSRLVRRATDGDQRAWNELVQEFGGLVWGVARAYGLSASDAADVSQITWQRLVENLDRLHDHARVGAWLATTARRECMRHVRRASRLIPHGEDLPEQISQLPSPSAAVLADERDQALRSALARLPARDRKLLRMLAAEPAPSYVEISAALQMPIGSIGPTRARALERLRHEVRRHGLSDPHLG